MDDMDENELQDGRIASARALVSASVPGLNDEQTAAVAELVIEVFGRGFDEGRNTAVRLLFEGAIITRDIRQSVGQ